MAYVFRGGIYFGENKSKKVKIERLTPPEILRVPMSVRNGIAVTPLVSVGDTVLRGAVIGNGESEASLPVHSPVSGVVTAIGEMTLPDGEETTFVEIKNDSKYTVSPDIKKCEKRLAECESDEIVGIVRGAGIVAEDGTPAHEKITASLGNAEVCILNCVFDEPYVSGVCRLLTENPSAVINGFKIILKALSLRRGIIVIGEGSSVAIRRLNFLLRRDKLIKVTAVRSKYPGGSPREVVYSVTGRELREGETPESAGCVIFDALTAANIYSAFASGMPYVSRVVSLDGDAFDRPRNLLVPIGTSFSDLIAYAGGLKKEASLIIDGGPFRGNECEDMNAVVTKTTTAVLIFSKDETESYSQPPACIRCGRCFNVCPVKLYPANIYKYVTEGKLERAIRSGTFACEMCGACSYVCPGKLPITESIRRMRAEYERPVGTSTDKDEAEASVGDAAEVEAAQAEEHDGDTEVEA